MTREEAAKLLPILQAFAEGRQIEGIYKGLKSPWMSIENLELNEGMEFRVKPEPTYRPFANAEECWKEMQKHQPFGWIISKEYKKRSCLSIVPEEEEFRSFFKCYTFADGHPFGIKKEE